MKTLLTVLILAALMIGSVILVGGCQQRTGIAARLADQPTSAPSDNANRNPGDNGSEWYGSDSADAW